MLIRDPQHRVAQAGRVLNKTMALSEVKDDKVKELLKVILGEDQDPTAVYAWEKYQDELSRVILNSYLLSDTTFDKIRRTTGVPLDVLNMYALYFFDVTIFRDQLEKVSYVGSQRGRIPSEQQVYLEAALTKGADYITWLLNGNVNQTPKRVLEAVMTEGYFMGQSHKGQDPTSDVAKQARNWLQMGNHAAINLLRAGVTESDDAFTELRLALTFDNNVINQTTEGAPAPDDIIH